ncbi:MAG: sigma-70 family RNA polymerase sigma factor [Tissierellia bacterium]|nr:sigma-70 family RNA polymerase sigma factor [Tissierellia bacterium]
MIIFLASLNFDEREFVEKLFLRLNFKMYKVAFNILKEKSDTQEAVANSFVNIMESIEKIMALPCPQIDPYCVTIVKRESINIIRKRKNLVVTDEIYQIADEKSTEAEFILNIDIEKLVKYVNRLKLLEKDLLILRYAEKQSYRQIGEVLGISEEAAKKRGQRILTKLKKYYEEDYGNEK